MKKLLLVTTAAVALTAPARAADLPVKAPPVVAPVWSWAGFYIGGNVGVAWLDKSVTDVTGVAASNGPEFSLRAASITAGGQAGYNWHANNWLIGLEADFNWTRINRTDPTREDDILRGKVDWFATFRGRVGYAPGPWLVYVTGGAAMARLTNEYGDVDPGGLDPVDSVSTRRTRWGWTVGGGGEFALAGTSNWSAKFEYLFIDFRTFSVAATDGAIADFQDRMHVVRIGLNYRFGGPVVARY